MITVDGLTKDYGVRKAIDNISFHANKGEILGFLGPNGAGKTTTMRILAGYMPPTAGKATIGGFDVVQESLEVRKIVGYLPETVPLYTDMSVFDYLKYMAELHHVADVEDRVEDVMAMVRMDDRADSYISSLSKGMRQRVGLAQALVPDPDVLILDEPTIGLDPAQIIEVRKLIRELGQDHTILLSTHILSEAQQICNRVLIINKGIIVAEDTPQKLEAHLSGVERVHLQVTGPETDLEPLIRQVTGVTDVTLLGQGHLEFMAETGSGVRPQVAKAVIDSGYDLLEFRSMGMSLEEIFLELTQEEGINEGDQVWEDENPKEAAGNRNLDGELAEIEELED